MSDAAPAERHGAAILPILRLMFQLVGDNPVDLMILAESLVLGLFKLVVRLGGDEPVLETFTDRLRERLAQQRLGDIDTKGSA